jgi:iron complex transport system substrate-binding protein
LWTPCFLVDDSTREARRFCVGERVKKGKSEKAWFVIVAIGLALSLACQRPAENVATPGPMRQVTDDLGRVVTVPAKITRVVSTAPSVTENVFAVGAGDRLVGVTSFCNYPEEAKAIAKIGDTMNPNMETIVALKPDVVLVSSASQLENFTKLLEQNGIAVYVTNPTSLDEVFKDLIKLGELFETRQQAEKLVADLENRYIALLNPGPLRMQSRVFVQISREPLFTVGKQSFLTPIVGVAAGESVTANVASAYPKLSKETASAMNPDVIIISESPDNQEPNDAFKNSPAAKNGRVYKVDADLLSRPGPRLIDAMEQMAKMLHPERFPE